MTRSQSPADAVPPKSRPSPPPPQSEDSAVASSTTAPGAAPAPIAASARTSLRNNFDLEPNPFEQSFSTSHPSVSLTSQATEKDDKRSASPKPLLPPLAAITSSSDAPFSWSNGISNSLRAGPLSPAMLTGPQQHPTGLTPYTDHHQPFGRTGLTPGTGLTPLIGGPSSFPPPSPNTAAFLAMVTNGAPDAMSSAVSATITPNTLAAITGVIQSNLPNQMHPPHPLSVSHVPGQQQQSQQQQQPQQQTFDPTNQRPSSSSGTTASSTSYFQQHQQQQQQSSSDPYAASAGTAAANAANALYLLSQQHQEMTKRNEAANANQQSKRGSKRKSIDGPPPQPPPATRAKKQRAPPKGRSRSKKDDTPEFDSDESADEEMQVVPSKKKPETEEEKRRNFLERNRQAALKCRQRKKAWLAQLQQKVEFLAAENERLTSALVGSREEIARLNNLVVQSSAGVAPAINGSAVNQPAASQAGQGGAVSVSVSLPMPAPPPALGKSQSHSTTSSQPTTQQSQHHSHQHHSHLPSQPASVSVGGGGGSGQRGYGY